MLSIRDLNVEYQQNRETVPVVRGVSLEIPEGSALALVGESGSGKSTLALAIMGMAGRITGGDVWLNDLNLTEARGGQMRSVLRNEIGFVPQDPTTSLDPLFTVRSQVAEVMSRGKDVDERIVALLDSLGVVDARRRLRAYPHEFSGGMRQRVAIAIALAKDPSLLIADEPTTALDVTTQLGILRLLDDLRTSRNLTTLFITHNLRVARLLCQDAAVMYAGIVVESGPMEPLMTGARHPYTRALLAATVADAAPRSRLAAIPGQPPSSREVPDGCPFAPRCPRALARCRTTVPEPQAEGGVTFRCFNPVTS